ncbi:hypothetical protein BBO_07588 [Beauveria brongniartii RCEF 3172]|uniref:PD-(D/E)XK nuclease-like domain-containing protein n=1 Tax=Beauveria brongniartii RCEF 3172 TaxID=1081107 RepID=A0A166Z4S0_9HYPO|nr:hypothetical protein BBO_07588 [Beauveria brongniartii RCEF 3172]
MTTEPSRGGRRQKRKQTNDANSANETDSQEEIARYNRLLPFKDDLAALGFALPIPTTVRRQEASSIPPRTTVASSIPSRTTAASSIPSRTTAASSIPSRATAALSIPSHTTADSESLFLPLSDEDMPGADDIQHDAIQGSDEGTHESGTNYDESQSRVPCPRPSASRLATPASKDRHNWLTGLSPSVIGQANTDTEALARLPKSLWEFHLELRRNASAPGSYRMFFPSTMRDVITDRLGRGPLPDSFFYSGPACQIAWQMREARRSLSAETEFDKAEVIVAKANQCEAGSYIDSRWNLNVRVPLLKFVLGGSRKMAYKALTGKMTTSLKEFDPVAASTNARPPKQSGKVTMGLFFENEELTEVIEEKLNTVYDGKAFVNPWEQTNLRHLPVAYFFETSATEAEQDSVAEWGSEMGRQVAAVHHRLSDFLDAKYYDLNRPLADASDTYFHDEWTEAHRKDMRHQMQLGSERPLDESDEPWERPLIPALPQICVRGHDWYLYFACDRGKHIDLLDGHWMGSSRDLADVYFLIKNLRIVVEYLEKEYFEWIWQLFIQVWDRGEFGELS